jgi:hypothetical protein
MTGTGRRKANVVTVERSERTAALRGLVRVVHPAIRRAGCEWEYDHFRHAYEVPLGRLDDVTAALERAGHIIRFAATGW